MTVGQERYYGLSCLERVIAIEQLSAGDAGVFLGSPGPSMSSVIISALADPQQKERYYSHFLKGTAWSFFALTEPEKVQMPPKLAHAFHVMEKAGWS